MHIIEGEMKSVRNTVLNYKYVQYIHQKSHKLHTHTHIFIYNECAHKITKRPWFSKWKWRYIFRTANITMILLETKLNQKKKKKRSCNRKRKPYFPYTRTFVSVNRKTTHVYEPHIFGKYYDTPNGAHCNKILVNVENEETYEIDEWCKGKLLPIQIFLQFKCTLYIQHTVYPYIRCKRWCCPQIGMLCIFTVLASTQLHVCVCGARCAYRSVLYAVMHCESLDKCLHVNISEICNR